jgi:hypothetical protein
MEEEVVFQLLDEAHETGAIGVTGRIEPAMQHALAKSVSGFSPRQGDMLLHSKHPKLIPLITTGRAFLSRLEGEWCLRFK